MVVAELEKTLSSFPVVDSVVSLLDGVVEKLSALKRKVMSATVLYTRTQPPHLLLFPFLVPVCNNYTVAMDNQVCDSDSDNLVLKRLTTEGRMNVKKVPNP